MDGPYTSKDSDWNYKDVPHLNIVHESIQSVQPIVSEEYVGSIVTLFLESTDGTEFKIQITERELSKFNIQNGNKYWLSWSEKNVHVLIEE